MISNLISFVKRSTHKVISAFLLIFLLALTFVSIFFSDPVYSVSLDTNVSAQVGDGVSPYIKFWASEYRVAEGSKVRLFWESQYVADLKIDNGIGPVDVKGELEVELTETTTFKIKGRKTEKISTVESENIVTKELTIIVGDFCPTIVKFEVMPGGRVKVEDIVTFSWTVTNAEEVRFYDGVEEHKVKHDDSKKIMLHNDTKFKIIAKNNECVRESELEVRTNLSILESEGQLVLLGVVALETISMGIGTLFNYDDSILSFFLNFFNRIVGRKSWGLVYDSVTKKRLARAVVRLLDAKTGSVIQTSVTDAYGIFNLRAGVGVYKIEVKMKNYIYPSNLVKLKNDGSYGNVYRGELINVRSNDQIIMFSIPLDPGNIKLFNEVLGKLNSYARFFFRSLFFLAYVGLFFYSFYVFYIYRVLKNAISLIVYIIFLAIRFLGRRKEKNQFGKITTEDGKPLANVEIGLFDADFDMLVTRAFSDSKGQYNFVVANDRDYYITLMDLNYSINTADPKRRVYVKRNKKSRSNIVLIKENIVAVRRYSN